MLKNINNTIKIFYLNSIIFFLPIFSLHLNAETKIIAKSGDTLLKLSKQYGVTLKELMYKNNFDDATLEIEGEIILIPLKNKNKDIQINNRIYKVVEGDTLFKIAREHNVSLNEIIDINNLKNDSFLEINQIIILPKGSEYKKEMNKKNIRSEIKTVFFHQTSKLESLSTIAEIHKIPIEKIKVLNNLNNTKKVKSNTKIKLRENKNKSLRWLKYESLIINWSDWTYLEGNYITEAKTKNNKSFYIAINCKKRTLNNTLNNSYWKSWYFPKTDFEFKLLNDFCDKGFNF